MKDWSTLERQITATMVAVALTTIFIMYFSFTVVYWFIQNYAPRFAPSGFQVFPTKTDFIVLLSVALIGLVITAYAATRTATRIVKPIASVILAARKVAEGDLTARAELLYSPPGETSVLVQDFNNMAEKLEHSAAATRIWNAQIAHELRTPLAVLSGRLQGIADGVFTADENTMTSIRKQVHSLIGLVEDLRAVSLSESGYLSLSYSTVCVSAEIEDVVTLMRHPLEERGLVIELNLDPSVANVDPARVRQAMMAILDNAIKYSDPGKIRISLIFGKGQFEITVQDSGPGMSNESAHVAFEPFGRGDKARTRQNGSGLGLTVVKAIVSAHGGHVSYLPEDNTFRLNFPVGEPWVKTL